MNSFEDITIMPRPKSKVGVMRIAGNQKPVVGQKQVYTIAQWYPDTPAEKRNLSFVTWELFKKRPNGRFTSTGIKKKGVGEFTFGEVAVKNTYRLEAYLLKPEGRPPVALEIVPQPSATPKISKVDIKYVDDTPGKVFSYREKLIATAHTTNLKGKKLKFTLWEDDMPGAGHHRSNKNITSRNITVGADGTATAVFTLAKEYILSLALRYKSNIFN